MPTHVPLFVLTTWLLAMLPGAGQALMLRQTLDGGRRLAAATIAGTATGLLLWSTAAAAGLSAVLLADPALYATLRTAGGAVLVLLGLNTLRSLRHTPATARPRNDLGSPNSAPPEAGPTPPARPRNDLDSPNSAPPEAGPTAPAQPRNDRRSLRGTPSDSAPAQWRNGLWRSLNTRRSASRLPADSAPARWRSGLWRGVDIRRSASRLPADSAPVWRCGAWLGGFRVGGVGSASARVSSRRAPVAEAGGTGGLWRGFLGGLAVNLGNPKAGVFAVSMLPQFVSGDGPVLLSSVGLGVVWAGVTAAWYLLFVSVVDRGRALVARSGVRRGLQAVTGGVLLVLGGVVAFGG